MEKNDCIATIQFIQKSQKQANSTNIITMINVYAPQTQRLKNDKIELHGMYKKLVALLREVLKTSNILYSSWF